MYCTCTVQYLCDDDKKTTRMSNNNELEGMGEYKKLETKTGSPCDFLLCSRGIFKDTVEKEEWREENERRT